ncbi:MAG TPA: ABC transporter permease [Thermoanaerobaculia bacterium]|nr:ABC transporter permease [Thermoanaerobaculia bacterium]
MTGYLARRLASTAVTLAGIIAAVFLLIHAAPGDPALLYAGARPGEAVPEAILAEIRHAHGLDRPLGAQFASWAASAARLDFGESIFHRRSVAELIGEKLPQTILLNGLALLLAILIGVPVGVASAVRPGSLFDRASATTLFLLYSLPTFWTALMLIEIFGVRLQLLPLFGNVSSSHDALGAGARFGDRVAHLVLPVTVLAYALIAFLARFVRSSLREVLGQEYVRTARAKGAPAASVVWSHAFRNALVPMVSLLAVIIPWLISGSVIVEQIFQWNGIGSLFFGAILSRDYPLVMGLTVVTALVTVAASFVADALYALVDPRIRVGGSS